VLDVIVAVQLKVPVPETVAVQPLMPAPELIEAVMVAPGVNPAPERATDTPLGPWVGVSVRAGAVTMYGAVALSAGTVAESEPLAVTV
jgi:hypothetical protein